ncbi:MULTISPECIES: recombinase family protein [Streptomyces]|nr:MULTISPECIES: recombinase family protein [Streptomyces]MDI5910737.1 recombinase family protein [Streptomyces sp. 12257]
MFAAIAKFQRQQIVKGTREGLDAARARGRVGGCAP